MAKPLRVFANCNQISVCVVTLVLLLGSSFSAAAASSSSCSGGGGGDSCGRAIGVLRRALATGNATVLTQSLLQDGETLLEFKAAISSDPTKALLYWKPQGKRRVLNACRWPGITCKHRRVFAVDLFNKQLRGSIPSSLGQLALLSSLNLSGNVLSGPFAMQTGSFPSLVTLDLSDNQMNGSIPTDVGNLTSLLSLDLSRNPLGGVIPATLGKLFQLQSLRLTSCNLTGPIPQGLAACTQLQELKLDDNSLQGNIPPSLASLPQLISLDLGSNSLEGDFLSFVANASSLLQDLILSNNRLSGVIPPSLGTGLQKLTFHLSLAHNQLSGPIPTELGELDLVQNLDLSFNNLSGSIPASIANCSSLLSLILSHNGLNGSIPAQLGNLTKLTELDLSVNDLSGSIPATLTNINTLTFLNVSDNNLEGLIPNFTHSSNITASSFLDNPGLCGIILNRECPSPSSSSSLSRSSHATRNKILIGAFVGGFGLLWLLLLLVCCCYYFMFKKSRGSSQSGGKFSASVSDELQLQLSAEEIMLATGGFVEANVIGRGHSSTVFRGEYNDIDVAVKRLNVIPSPSLQQRPDGNLSEAAAAAAAAAAAVDIGEPDTELQALASVRHNSLVRVVGYCSTPEIKALVLEYMPNGSLETLLHPSPGAELVQTFNWNSRLNVAIGAAQGLVYLHHDHGATPLVHGNVKPSNILFDAKLRARISDFGISTILAAAAAASSDGAASGYSPPEAGASGTATVKWDVYSYGIVVLEMLSGRRPDDRLKVKPNLPAWIRKTVSESKTLQQVLDPVLLPDLSSHQQRIAMVMGLALMCTRDIPEERPTMKDVLKKLMEIKNRFQNKSQRSSRDSRQSSKRPMPHTPSLSHWSGTTTATTTIV